MQFLHKCEIGSEEATIRGKILAVLAVLVVCTFIGIGGQASALVLPNPYTDTLYHSLDAPVALPFGDFWSYSLPTLAFFEDLENGGGTGPGNPYYVTSTPGAIKDGIVIATGTSSIPATTNPAGMDNAYPTPNSSGIPNYTTANTPDPGQVAPFAGDNPDTWDIQLSALDAYLAGSNLLFFFNNNQVNSGAGGDQNLLAWAQVNIVDLDGAAPTLYFDLTNNNSLPAWPSPVQLPDGPGGYVSPGIADADWPFQDSTGDFPEGPTDLPLPPGESIPADLDDIVLSGGPITFHYYITNPAIVEEETIDHNLGADQAVYVMWSPEIDFILQGTDFYGYDVMQIDFRFADLNSGYEQIFIQRGEVGSPIPEPTTMLLLGTGLVGLAGLGRKKFLK